MGVESELDSFGWGWQGPQLATQLRAGHFIPLMVTFLPCETGKPY